MMSRKPIWTALATALAGLLVAGSGSGRSKSFALVYHSDARGYYRPCG